MRAIKKRWKEKKRSGGGAVDGVEQEKRKENSSFGTGRGGGGSGLWRSHIAICYIRSFTYTSSGNEKRTAGKAKMERRGAGERKTTDTAVRNEFSYAPQRLRFSSFVKI